MVFFNVRVVEFFCSAIVQYLPIHYDEGRLACMNFRRRILCYARRGRASNFSLIKCRAFLASSSVLETFLDSF